MDAIRETLWRQVACLSNVVFVAVMMWLTVVLVMRPITLTIVPGKTAYMPDAAKELLMNVRVNAPVCLTWQYAVRYRDNEGSYTLRMANENSEEPPKTRWFLEQLSPPSEANGFWIISNYNVPNVVCPGKDYEVTLNVSKYYDLSMPGTYTAEVIAEPVKVLLLGTIPSRPVVSNQATFQVTSSNFLPPP